MPRGPAKKENNAKKQKRGIARAHSREITVLAAVLTVLAIGILYFVNGNIILRFAAALAVLMLSGSAIAAVNGMQSSYGLYLLGGKGGMDFVDSLSKKNIRFWTFLSDWGLAVSFGLLSFAMFRRQVSKKMILFGIVSVVAILVFVYPYLSVVISFINIPQLTAEAASASSSAAPSAYIFYYLLIASGVIGGLSVFGMYAIFYGGGKILYGILLFIAEYLSSKPDTSGLSSQVPGVAPLIPGLTLPLVAGLISLIAILIIHEFSHGALARIAKVKLKSIGVVLFGIIPIGAFVEPDEKAIKRLGAKDKDRIFAAGVSANILASLVFFVAVAMMIYLVLPSIGTGGVRVTGVLPNTTAYGVIAPNTVILKWNGVAITNDYDLARVEAGYVAGNYVNVTTSAGSYLLMPSSEGKLGIAWAPAVATTAFQIANFVYSVVALLFALNFFVAVLNLLPIPGFDGWRIYEGKVKNKKALMAIAVLLIAAIVVNALPWLWTL